MKAAASIVVVDSRGLTVEQDTVLRRNLRGSEVGLKLSSSNAASCGWKTGAKILHLFVGPSAVAFSQRDDRTCENLERFCKDAEALEIKGGAIEGAVI